MNRLRNILKLSSYKGASTVFTSAVIFSFVVSNTSVAKSLDYNPSSTGTATTYSNIPENYFQPTDPAKMPALDTDKSQDYARFLDLINSTTPERSGTDNMKRLAVCGNGFIDEGEDCDVGWDKNGTTLVDDPSGNGAKMRGYGCSENCTSYRGWNCNGFVSTSTDPATIYTENNAQFKALYDLMTSLYTDIKEFADNDDNWGGVGASRNCATDIGDPFCMQYEYKLEYFYSINKHTPISCDTKTAWQTTPPKGVSFSATDLTNYMKLRYRAGEWTGFNAAFEDPCS